LLLFSEIVNGFLSNAVPAFTKWVFSLKPTTKKGIDLSQILNLQSTDTDTGHEIDTNTQK